MPDTPGRPLPGPDILVLRAVFVPDGEQPPPEFAADFDPLHFPARLNRATGVITCVNAGISFDGDVRAEWHADKPPGSAGVKRTSAEPPAGGGSDAAEPARQRKPAAVRGNQPADTAWSTPPGGRTPFGLGGYRQRNAVDGGPPPSPKEPVRVSASQTGRPAISGKTDDGGPDAALPNTAAEQNIAVATRDTSPGSFAPAGNPATDAGAARGDAPPVRGGSGREGQPMTSAKVIGGEPIGLADRPGPASTASIQGAAVRLPDGENHSGP